MTNTYSVALWYNACIRSIVPQHNKPPLTHHNRLARLCIRSTVAQHNKPARRHSREGGNPVLLNAVKSLVLVTLGALPPAACNPYQRSMFKPALAVQAMGTFLFKPHAVSYHPCGICYYFPSAESLPILENMINFNKQAYT